MLKIRRLKTRKTLVAIALLTMFIVSFAAVLLTRAHPEVPGTIDIQKNYYKTGDTVLVTLNDNDLNVPIDVSGEIIGKGDGVTKTFYASKKPILDRNSDGKVDPYDVTAYDLQLGSVVVLAVDASTGKITLLYAPAEVWQTLLDKVNASATESLTTQPSNPSRLKVTVYGATTGSGTVTINGTIVNNVTLVETPNYTETLTFAAMGSKTTTNYFKLVNENGITTTGLANETDPADIKIEETQTVAADYRSSGIDTATVKAFSTTDSTGINVTLTETGYSTGTFTGNFKLVNTGSNQGATPPELNVTHGNTVTAQYQDASPVATVSDTAQVDNVAPTIINLIPANGTYVTTSTPTISATLADPKSGINSTTIVMKLDDVSPPVVSIPSTNYTYNVSTGVLSFTPGTDMVYTSLPNGVWYVTVNVSDVAGNTATASWNFTVDTTPPAVPTTVLTSPNGNEFWIGGSVHNITWNSTQITDANLAPNPISLYYTSDNGTTWTLIAGNEANDGTYNWTVPTINSALCKVRINATDLAGNYNSDKSDAVFTIDSTPPAVTLTAPLDNSYINVESYNVAANASDPTSGIANVTFSWWNGTAWLPIGTDATTPYQFTWNLTGIPDQTGIQVKANATNKCGLTKADININITHDTTPPTAPTNLNATATPGAIVLNWTAATDATSGVALYKVYRNTTSGGPYNLTGNATAPQTTYFDSTGSTGVQYFYVVKAVDAASNEGTASNEANATYIPGAVTNIVVTASPTTITADGFDASTITAAVTDQYGNPIPGANVSFTTTIGTITPLTATTYSNGSATTTLTSLVIGTANVTATAGSITDSTTVNIIGAGGVKTVTDLLDEIEAKLDNPTWGLQAIKTAIDAINMTGVHEKLNAIEAKLDAGGTFYTFVNDWFTTIGGKLDAIKTKTETINWTEVAAIGAKLDNSTYGLQAIKTAIDAINVNVDLTPVLNATAEIEAKLDAGGTFYTFVNDWFTTIGTKIDLIQAKTDLINWDDIATIKSDVSDIKSAVGAPLPPIDGTVTCTTGGTVQVFNVTKAMTDGNPFKVYFTIDAQALDTIDQIYVNVYIKTTATSSLILARQSVIVGITGSYTYEVNIDSIVNAEQVVVNLAWRAGITSDDPINYQVVISSP